MENNKKTREPLDDDALGKVTGGFTDAVDGGYIDAYNEMKGLVILPDDGKFKP